MPLYKGVMHFKKWSGFLAHPVQLRQNLTGTISFKVIGNFLIEEIRKFLLRLKINVIRHPNLNQFNSSPQHINAMLHHFYHQWFFLFFQWQQCRARTIGSCIMSMPANATWHIVLQMHSLMPFLSVLIVFHLIHPNTSVIVQLINFVSNLIFHCNHCDANSAFITIHESMAASPSRPSGLLNAKFTFKGTSPTNHRTDSQANKRQHCR